MQFFGCRPVLFVYPDVLMELPYLFRGLNLPVLWGWWSCFNLGVMVLLLKKPRLNQLDHPYSLLHLCKASKG
jgi:hypothetical protein